VPGCPACGAEVPADALECPRCHLAVHLFDAVREAVGVPENDPRYSTELRELLQAVEPTPEEGAKGPATLAYPARFPAPSGPSVPPPEGETPPPLDALPALPELPSGGIPALRRQLDDFLQVARRQSLDVADLVERSREGISLDDARTLETVVRELFVRLAAALSEQYEAEVGQRNGLVNLVPLAHVDAELAGARGSLLAGDVAAAQRRLKTAGEQLDALEESWSTFQILLTECDLLTETIRELGGDPGPALGPLEEGRRLGLEGRKDEAEPVLARATVALWSVLNPRFLPEMRRIKDALLARRAAGADVGRAVEEFRELTAHLAARNFGATITGYRRLRAFVDVPSSGPAEAAPVPSSAAAAK
jgi:hypothetical protein